MWLAIFKALFASLFDAFRDWRIERDYQEALILNAEYDAAARERAGADATRARIRDVETSTDVGILRDFLRARDPNTK